MTQTLPLEQFLATAKQQAASAYLHQPINRELEIFNWSEVEQQARSVAKALLDLGLVKGDRVGIASKNCAQWFIADIAIMMAGLISVPVYPTANRDTVSYILKHSGCKVVFVGKLDNAKEIAAGIDSHIECIAFPYDTAKCQHQWADLIKTPALTDLHQAKAEDTLSIVYTSGSTGNPKGVVLSYANFAAGATDAKKSLAASPDDSVMSYLPLAHITERALIEMSSFYGGCKIYFVESLDSFIDDVKTGQPDLFVSVPRLWSKFQAEILQKMPEKKLRILLKIPGINRIVKNKIKLGLGLTQARIFGSGSAPISPAILQWYQSVGIPISEGW
ncbi:MAG: AMP-binding protein, partial [Pseudomonadales bacterium]|nr:AMP-binding protein [Pseudomonadales bacterium]